MVGKGVDFTQASLPESVTGPATSPGEFAIHLRLLHITLSGTVLVDYELEVEDPQSGSSRAVVRVEFPDEVRSMLESSTWSRGTSILEAVSQLGATYLERLARAGVVRPAECNLAIGLPRHPATFHIPLADLRSSLATVCASGV